MPHHLAVFIRQPGSTIEQHAFQKGSKVAAANITHTPQTLRALAAGDHPGTDHMISFLEMGDPRTNFFHYTGSLMTDSHGQSDGNLAQHQMEI
jgi:hypothetical protein